MTSLTITEPTPEELLAVAYAMKHTDAVLGLANGGTTAAPAATTPVVNNVVEIATPAAAAQSTPATVAVGTSSTPASLFPAPAQTEELSAEQVFGGNAATPVTTAAPTGVVTGVQPTAMAQVAPTAAAAVTTAATASPSNEELDSAGFPWDERINVGTKTKVVAGTWKVKPKTDKAFLDSIHEEYRQQGYGTPQTQAAPQTATSHAHQTSATLGSATAPVVDYPTVMGQITTGIAGKRFTPVQVSEVLAVHGINSTGELATFDHLFGEVRNQLEALANANNPQ